MPSRPRSTPRRPRHVWSAAQLAYLREHYATTRTADLAAQIGLKGSQVYIKAHSLGLRKSHALKSAMARARMADPTHPGRRTQFATGSVPANKGKRYTLPRPGSVPTQFKPGQLSGRAAHLAKPLGTLRINDGGYLDRKVSELPGPSYRRWHPVHRLVWEATHGPVPRGYVVVFRDGKHTTVEAEITLDRVELVSRRELMRRNSVHTRQSPELARISQLRGVLTRQIKRLAGDPA